HVDLVELLDGVPIEMHPSRHIRDRHRATQAADLHGRDDRRMRTTLERRRTGDDALHAGDLGGDDRHMRGGDHRIAPARHVAADRVDRTPPPDPGREQRITTSDSRESPNRVCKKTSRHTPQTSKFDYFVTCNQSVRSMASEFFTTDYLRCTTCQLSFWNSREAI